jgi:beta-1,4-mannosyltransferase
MRAAVIVLGDLGRSPRMQYHALALAAEGAEVNLIGYTGAPLVPAVAAHRLISSHRIAPPALDRGPERATVSTLGQAAWQLFRLAVRLARALFLVIPQPDVVLVQNPPAIPTLAVAVAVARLRLARLVIDWHNLGHSVLASRLGAEHRLVRFTRWYERFLAGFADHHLVVSNRMRGVLVDTWRLEKVTVLYDRPAELFTPLPGDVRETEKTRLLELDDPAAAHAVGLLVTATSWSLDEDLGLLLEALDRCEARIRCNTGPRAFPDLEVVISGDGPQKATFEARLATRPVGRIRIRTCWLSPEDYPRLLGAADLGVCLHRSTSGLDLPMKLADMLGCGLPVCVLDYGPVLRERLSDGHGCRCFSTAEELASQILELFDRFPASEALSELRNGTHAGDRTSWRQGWGAEARAALVPTG